MSEAQPPPAPVAEPVLESRRTGMSVHAIVTIVVLIAIIALLLANTRSVKVSWVFGSTRQSLIWIVLVTAILGWLLGISTALLFRRRRAQKP
jgi:uncharacterized integral membrane protein